MSQIIFESNRPGIITQAELESIHERLMSSSAYQTRVGLIESANSSSFSTRVIIGEFGQNFHSVTPVIDPSTQNVVGAEVRISISALLGNPYNEFPESWNTIERVLAHEVGGHVWHLLPSRSWTLCNHIQ